MEVLENVTLHLFPDGTFGLSVKRDVGTEESEFVDRWLAAVALHHDGEPARTLEMDD